MIDFETVDLDAPVELWVPKVGERVRVRVSEECNHPIHEREASRHRSELLQGCFGTVIMVSDDPHQTVKIYGKPKQWAIRRGKRGPWKGRPILAEYPQRGHRFAVRFDDAGTVVCAAIELEPA